MINKKLTVILLFLLTFFMIMSSVSASEITTTSDNTHDGETTIIGHAQPINSLNIIPPIPDWPWEDGPFA